MIGATPMTSNQRESAPRLLTVTPAAGMALIAAPTKHTPTTSRNFPTVPGPCNPGTQRPRVTDRNLLFGRGGTLTQRRGCSRRNCTETWSEWTICPRRPLPASAGRGRRGMPSLVGRPPQRRRRRSGVETGLDWPARDATACRRRTTQRNAARPPPLVFLGLAFSPRPPPRAPAVADLAPGFAPTTRSAAGSFRSRPSGVAR